MTQTFEGEVLKVAADGTLSVVTLTVTDDDLSFENSESNAEWAVDGKSLGSDGPDLFGVSLDLTRSDGSVDLFNYSYRFDFEGDQYYLMPIRTDPNAIVGIGPDNVVSTTNAVVNYLEYGLAPLGVSARHADVLVETFSGTGAFISLTRSTIFVFDDDDTIEFFLVENDGLPDAINAQAVNRWDLTTNDLFAGDTNMVLYDIDYTTPTTTGTLTAIKLTATNSPGGTAMYLPQTGHDQLSGITELTSQTVVGTSVQGDLWSDYDLSTVAQTRVLSATQGNFLMGLPYAEIMNGFDFDDSIYGLLGDDIISGAGGADILVGGVGADDIDGGLGGDTLIGGPGDDTLDGAKNADSIKGGDGADEIIGGKGADTLLGGAGHDTITGSEGDDNIAGNGNRDSITGDEGADLLEGGYGGDTLDGGTEADTLLGEAGHDSLVGGDHDDEIDAGAGNDTIGAGKGDDRVVGRAGADDISGGKGDDTLRGNGGKDTINGGLGADEMTGGTQADTFVLTADSATDTITDFEDGIDLIDLDVAFADLSFTDISPGEVHVTHSGETLVILDDAGVLTSANLDQTDFI